MGTFEVELNLFLRYVMVTSLRGQEVECCGLCRNDPHILMCLNGWPIGSGTIRRSDHVKGSMSLWVGFEVLYTMLKLCPGWHPVCFCCLWVKMWNSQLLSQHHVFLHVVMFPTMIIAE